ncbi:MAG: S8 family peptidase [Elusimicrobiota bacterium]
MKLLLTLIAALLAAAPALGGPTPVIIEGNRRWIVIFKPQVRREGRESALATLGAKLVKHVATDGDTDNEFSAAVVDLPVGETLGKSLPIFDAMTAEDAFAEDIVSIEADQRLNWIKQTSFQAHPLPGFDHVMESLNVPKAVQFAEIARTASFAANRPEITWGINRVHAPAAWDTTEGAGARVAVIDTGIDMTHPDLAGQVDGGYSSITKTENPEDYTDDNGHGTHVAGTIAAVRDGKGVVGVAPKARLYAVKVMDADGSGNMSDVIDGIVWAAKNGMQIANMSLGAPEGSDAMRSAVIYAKSKNVVLVAAAGNSYGDPVSFPAAYPEVIAVSASDAKDILAPFSSRGPQVQFIAPGMDVISSKMGGGFASFSGTSMACPHVAGLAALTISQGYVGLSGPDGVLAQLKRAAKRLPGLQPEEQGFGMIDAGKLVH